MLYKNSNYCVSKSWNCKANYDLLGQAIEEQKGWIRKELCRSTASAPKETLRIEPSNQLT